MSVSSSFHLRSRPIRIASFTAIAVVLSAGIAARLWLMHGTPGFALSNLLEKYLILDGEMGVPAWLSSCLLLSCGIAAAFAAALDRNATEERGGTAATPGGEEAPRRREGWFWWVIAVTFVGLSVDEAISLHEIFGRILVSRTIGPTSGPLFFSWVLAGGLFVLLFASASIPFLVRLRRQTAVRFVLSGALYLAGAIGMEMVGGWVAERQLPYYWYCIFVEEGLEMLGVTLFLNAIAAHLESVYGPLTIGGRTS